jgi:hypothetical protein
MHSELQRRQPDGSRDEVVFGERDVVANAPYWWLFLLTGIAWFVFSLLVFQCDSTTDDR